MKHKILRLPEVSARTGLSRSTIYARISQGAFPRSVSLGPRAVGWLESEVESWLESKIELRSNSMMAPGGFRQAERKDRQELSQNDLLQPFSRRRSRKNGN